MPKRTANRRTKPEHAPDTPPPMEQEEGVRLHAGPPVAVPRPARRPATRAATPSRPLPPGAGPGARIRSAVAPASDKATPAVVTHHPRRRLYAAISVLVLLAVLVGGTFGLVQTGFFRVGQVTVHGASYVDPLEIRRATDAEGRDLFRVSPETVRAQVERVSGIRHAKVRRTWPDGLTIVVEERTPAAVWQVGGVAYPVDRDGVVLDFAPDSSMLTIVQVDGARSLAPGDRVDGDAVVLAARLRDETPGAVGQRVAKFEWTQATGLEVTMDRGLRVRLGDSGGLDYKLAVWRGILDQTRTSGTAITEIDLRFGDRVFVR